MASCWPVDAALHASHRRESQDGSLHLPSTSTNRPPGQASRTGGATIVMTMAYPPLELER
jgi:hypothetical protein